MSDLLTCRILKALTMVPRRIFQNLAGSSSVSNALMVLRIIDSVSWVDHQGVRLGVRQHAENFDNSEDRYLTVIEGKGVLREVYASDLNSPVP